jgi:CheY-like chemotaxis protein
MLKAAPDSLGKCRSNPARHPKGDNFMGGLTEGHPLKGCRVLVVEDDYFLANDLEKTLGSCGVKIVGPIANLGEAQDQVRRGGFDVAVIDINLSGEFAWSIADELMREKIPFGFVTGYGADAILERFRHIVRWEKPYDVPKLTDDIQLLCATSKKSH